MPVEERALIPVSSPMALFIGDFNTGKSTLLNALLKFDLLYMSRTESHALPAFLNIGGPGAPLYWRLEAEQASPTKTTRNKWLSLRGKGEEAPEELAVGAHTHHHPFGELVLVDTPGQSSDVQDQIDLSAWGADPRIMLVIVADIEYWNARHTIALIQRHEASFAGRILVVANKADHLNADEIARIADKAHQRMERAGVAAPPAFIPLSARLELARHLEPDDEYRHRTKRPVRQWCDWGFDQLRVRLYEFERMLLQSPLDNQAKEQPLLPGPQTSGLAKAFLRKDDLHEVR